MITENAIITGKIHLNMNTCVNYDRMYYITFDLQKKNVQDALPSGKERQVAEHI